MNETFKPNSWTKLPPTLFKQAWRPPPGADHARVSDEVWSQYKGHFVSMFRPPHDRSVSSFAYFGKLKGSFSRYLERTEGTVVRMLAGQSDGAEWKCKLSNGTAVRWPSECVKDRKTGCGPLNAGYDVQSCGPAAVGKAIERLRTGFKFVGLTTHWNASVCLFHHKFGGPCHASEFLNTRPTDHGAKSGAIKVDRHQNGSVSHENNDLPPDEQLYLVAEAMFWQDIARYRLDAVACVAVCGPNSGEAFEHAFAALHY